MNTAKIHAVFAEMKAKGVMEPKLYIHGYKFKEAPKHGKNAGALYVYTRTGNTYIGKVLPNNIFYGMGLTEDTQKDIQKVVDSPMQEAIASGHRIGVCAICGRTLTNEDSIALGIGPICAEKVGAFLPEDMLKAVKDMMNREAPKKFMPFLETPEDF